MTPESRKKLRNLLTHHESFRQFPYVDTANKLTVGIGRNLTDRGISLEEALALLDDDISYFYNKLNYHLKFFSDLNEPRQIALIDLCFNVGLQGFLNFKHMILALEAHDYVRAAKELLESKWSDQVGERANDLAEIMIKGEL